MKIAPPPAEAAVPVHDPVTDASGRVTIGITKVADGGPSDDCFVNSKNGYTGGDDTTTDGVVCTGGSVTYRISYNVAQSDEPTTVKFRLTNDGVKPDGTRAGYPATHDVSWLRPDDASLRQFCQGGTGLYHTGTLDDQGVCTMTFAAGSSSSGSGTFFAMNPNESEGTFHVNLDILDNSVTNNYKTIATSKSEDVKAVNVLAIDPILYRTDTPSLTYVGGKPGMMTPLDLRAVVPGNGGGGGGEGGSKGKFSWSQMIRTKLMSSYTVDFSSYPAGTQVTVPEGWVYDPQTRIATVKNELIKPYHDSESGVDSFKVWVPLTSYDTTQDHTWEAKITQADYTPSVQKYFPQNWQGRPEPGMGQPADFNTGTLSSSYGVSIDSGQDAGEGGAKNNDYLQTTYKALPGAGTIGKLLVPDVDGKPGQNNYTYYSTVGANTPFWSKLFVKPTAAANTKNTTFCESFNNASTGGGQQVDLSRQPIVQWWDKATNAYVTPNYTIEYGTSGTGAAADGVSSEQVNRACNTGVQSWSATPDASTNTVRVVIKDEVAWDGDTSQVGQILLPMKTLDAKSYPNYPNSTRVFDGYAVDVQGMNSWSKTVGASFLVAGPINDLRSFDQSPKHINAGSVTSFDPMNYLFAHQGVFGPEDAHKAKLSFTTTVGSCVSDLQVPQSFKDMYNYSITKPDWGTDGLPCTPDDVSGWSVEYTMKGTTPELNVSDEYNFGPMREVNTQNWTYAVPGYVKSGTEIPISTNGSVVEGEGLVSETPGRNKDNVNARTLIVDSAATVGQSKFTTTPLARVGADVSWTTAWFNQSETATGEGTFIDVLPYNGDVMGTKISTQLSNIRIQKTSTTKDATIYVTADDPKTIQSDATKASTTNWVEYTGESKIGGKDITAIKIVQSKMDAGYIGGVNITANTKGDKDAEVVFNRLGAAKVDGFGLPIPTTAPVRSDLWDTRISGVAYWDANNNGKHDTNENRYFEGATVTAYDGSGDVLKTTTTAADGSWSIDGLPLGSYAVRITDRGGNILSSWIQTEPTPDGEYEGDLSLGNTEASDLDFGFFREINSKLLITKSAQGIENGGSVTNGSNVTWDYVVTNDGDNTVSNIIVKDNRGVDVKCPSTTLDAGKSMTCTGSGKVTPIVTDQGDDLR